MYVRLAFAVAAHLEPEILIVDEVLAVGDAEFQNKCLGKMSDVVSGGRTVLFVSHNMRAIETLCPRSICLEAGTLVGYAETEEVISAYLQQRRLTSRRGNIRSIQVQDGLVIERVSVQTTSIRCGDPIEIEIEFSAEASGQIRECAILFYSAKGMRVGIVDARESDAVPFRYQKGRFAIVVQVASLPLVEGEFAVGLYLLTDHFAGNLLKLQVFDIIAPRFSGFAAYPPESRGILALSAEVSVVAVQPPALSS